MSEREWLRKAIERRQRYRSEGERLFAAVWGDLVGRIQSHLSEYKAVDKSCRLEPWIESGAMTIGGVTIRQFLRIGRSRSLAWGRARSVFRCL